MSAIRNKSKTNCQRTNCNCCNPKPKTGAITVITPSPTNVFRVSLRHSKQQATLAQMLGSNDTDNDDFILNPNDSNSNVAA